MGSGFSFSNSDILLSMLQQCAKLSEIQGLLRRLVKHLSKHSNDYKKLL
jgi:aspartate ammonia-lyase